MKIKSLILAFPVLCLACSSPSDSSDPASNADATSILAKGVSGVLTLTSNAIYENPGHLLGEEYVRQTFNLPESTELEEVHEHDGSAFEWAGNKVIVSFNGAKPYSSIDFASYDFDKKYQNKPSKPVAPVAEAEPKEEAPETEGTATETSSTTAATAPEHEAHQSHPSPGITSATAPHTEPVVSKGSFEAVPGVGDKAVWNPTTGEMHVLYVNHIINVTVETKAKAEVRKEQALGLADVLIEKIANNEYIKRL
jgi:hypothetical protein